MEWIAVKDRFPEEDINVLVVANGFCYITYYYGDDWDMEDITMIRSKDFTHWMPLPKPPN